MSDKSPPCVHCGQRKDAHQLGGECIGLLYTMPQRCAANIASDPPQDCDAPFCGCDPTWSKCIEMLQECGWAPTGGVVPQDSRLVGEEGCTAYMLHKDFCGAPRGMPCVCSASSDGAEHG